jgi:response regulator RpfG family c-di-GMP phosphodiesterase
MSPMQELHLVVCVDDEPAILSALTRALRHEPYRVMTTGSPETVLEWLGSRDVSVIISDQRMPGVQGTELLEEVRRRSPETARIILTAYPEEVFQSKGVRSRTECLISKPWDGTLLKRTLRQLLFDREEGAREDRELRPR